MDNSCRKSDTLILDIHYKNIYACCDICFYKAIGNNIYIISKTIDIIYIYIIKNYVLENRYARDGIDSLINNDIIYILNENLILYKYNINNLQLIEEIEMNNINNINVNFINFVNHFKYDRYKIVYCDNPYIVSYFNNNKKNVACRIFDVNNNINYHISVKVVYAIAYNNENISIVSDKICTADFLQSPIALKLLFLMLNLKQ